MSATPQPARAKRKKRVIPINPATGLPFSKGTMKMRLLKRLKCTQKFEKLAWQAGAQLVAGVDEVGRGCLFGPVVAGAVILEPGYRIRRGRSGRGADRPAQYLLGVAAGHA
jgi:ribonuclease HII